MVRQHLDRDGAIQPRVARAVDLAHSTFAESGLNLAQGRGMCLDCMVNERVAGL